jgi:hypothetical protein
LSNSEAITRATRRAIGAFEEEIKCRNHLWTDRVDGWTNGHVDDDWDVLRPLEACFKTLLATRIDSQVLTVQAADVFQPNHETKQQILARALAAIKYAQRLRGHVANPEPLRLLAAESLNQRRRKQKRIGFVPRNHGLANRRSPRAFPIFENPAKIEPEYDAVHHPGTIRLLTPTSLNQSPRTSSPVIKADDDEQRNYSSRRPISPKSLRTTPTDENCRTGIFGLFDDDDKSDAECANGDHDAQSTATFEDGHADQNDVSSPVTDNDGDTEMDDAEPVAGQEAGSNRTSPEPRPPIDDDGDMEMDDAQTADEQQHEYQKPEFKFVPPSPLPPGFYSIGKSDLIPGFLHGRVVHLVWTQQCML